MTIEELVGLFMASLSCSCSSTLSTEHTHPNLRFWTIAKELELKLRSAVAVAQVMQKQTWTTAWQAFSSSKLRKVLGTFSLTGT